MAQKKTNSTAKATARTAKKAAPRAAATGEKTVETVAKEYEQAVAMAQGQIEKGQQAVETAVKSGSDAAAKSYEQAVVEAKKQVERSSTAFFKGFDELAEDGKENLDAYVKSSTIVAKGMEALAKELTGYTQASLEANMAAVKRLMGAKTLRDVVDVQSGFARDTAEGFVAETAKLTEMSVELANDAIQPIQTRANVSAKKLLKPVAA